MKQMIVATALVLAAQSGWTQNQQPDRIDRAACEKARRDYDVAVSSITYSKAARQAKREQMYGACGMREPDKTNINVRVHNYR